MSGAHARFAFVLLCMAAACQVRAWNGSEHAAIGREAYARACSSFPRPGTGEEGERWAIACRVMDLEAIGSRVLLAERFGEACALAGDHVGKPEDLLAKLGGRTAASPLHYGVLAATNFEHFHPTVRTSWREFHEQATRSAVTVGETRYAQEAVFLRALSEEAFAAHYLQDAFAAGHMGVNRPASSVSAVLKHHNRWNARGRCVANTRGDVWVAYGDAAYGRQSNDYVVEATAASLEDVLRSFVLARPHEDGYVRAADIAPSFGMAELHLSGFADIPDATAQNNRKWGAVATQCASLLPVDYEALDQIGWPAEVTRTIDAWWFADRVPRPDGTINLRGIVFGYSLAGLLIRLGPRRVATRAYLALGAAAVGPREKSQFFTESGYLLRVGMSNRGMVVYEVGFAGSAPFERDSATPGTFRLILGGNIEFGGFYVRVQAGPAARFHDKRAEWGPFYTVGIGRVLTARVMPAY